MMKLTEIYSILKTKRDILKYAREVAAHQRDVKRVAIDPQQGTFNEDLKTINQKMADLEIEIEYNRNMLKIRLAEVAGAANGVW